jgi:hypothetical protein
MVALRPNGGSAAHEMYMNQPEKTTPLPDGTPGALEVLGETAKLMAAAHELRTRRANQTGQPSRPLEETAVLRLDHLRVLNKALVDYNGQ